MSKPAQESHPHGLPRDLEARLRELEEECRRLREAFDEKNRELQSTLQE